jgi:hypothetical protein
MKISEIMSSGVNSKDFWDVVNTLDRSLTPDTKYPSAGYRVKASYEEAMIDGVYAPYIDFVIRTAFKNFGKILAEIRKPMHTPKRVLIQRHLGTITDADTRYLMIDGEETRLD